MPKIILTANTDWFLYNFRHALMQELRVQGYEVLLVSPPGEFVSRLEAEGFRWLPWKLKPHNVTPWGEVLSFLHIAQIYRRERPDIVHHHTIKAVLYGSLAAALVGVPTVVNTISGRGYVFLGKGWQPRLIRRLIAPFYRYALREISSAVIFENQADRHFFQKADYVLPERAHLIEGVGIDPQRFVPTPEPDEPILVLMAARIHWDKGVGVFVDAARLLHQRMSIRMVLVGKPEPTNPASIDESTLQAWQRAGLIEWWGWQRDMETIYPQSHMVVLPTMYGEGVPTTLLEAAACGRPLIATDLPGCRAVVKDGQTGILIPPDDPGSLAQAIERLAHNPDLRARLGQATRELVLEKFTREQINRATLQVIRLADATHS
jgi:glycosyltransferase involved in cell wall biosynthesis